MNLRSPGTVHPFLAQAQTDGFLFLETEIGAVIPGPSRDNSDRQLLSGPGPPFLGHS
jgi:hypothetical protein